MESAPDPLGAIRRRIDDIDEEVHRLLIDRSEVIDELIRVKGTSKPGAAFRPDREADMMRRMVVRHRGNLPLVTVEHIWREIITTFTAMQAPFGVSVGPAPDPLAMRDVVRFYFGFSVAVTTTESAEAALSRVAGPDNELAVVSASSEGRWWAPLRHRDGPKIFAKLPFIEIPGRYAAFPAYVAGPKMQEPGSPDVQLFCLPASPRSQQAVLLFGGQVVGTEAGEHLVELPVATGPDELAEQSGVDAAEIRACGGFAQAIRVVSANAF